MKISTSDRPAIRWIIQKASAQKWQIVVLSLCGMTVSGIAVLQAWCYREIIDRIKPTIETGDFRGIGAWSIFFVSIMLFGIFVSLFRRYLQDMTSADLLNAMRLSTISALFRKEYKALSSYHSGDILNRMFSDSELVSSNTVTLLPTVFSLSVRLIGSFVFMAFLSPRFAVFLLLCGVAMSLFAASMRKRLKRLHKDVQSAVGEVRALYQEQTLGMLMIKIFGADKQMRAKASERQGIYRKKLQNQKQFSALVNLGHKTIYNFLLLLAFFYGVYGILKGFMSYGSLTAMMQLAGGIQGSVTEISGLLPRFYSTVASAERVMELDALPDEKSDGVFLSDIDKVAFRDVSFTYGRECVLNHVDFTVKRGEIAAIQGASGAGKSTILLLLLGIYSPTEGRVLLSDGRQEIDAGQASRRLFSFVPQGNQLFSGTLYENIVFAREDASDEEIRRALEISCAAEFVDALPDGLQTKIGERGAGLSEGQQQRLAIARALLSKAPVLLFDEATSALDEATEQRLIENLKSIHKTCLLITHRKSPLSICTSAYILDENGMYQTTA